MKTRILFIIFNMVALMVILSSCNRKDREANQKLNVLFICVDDLRPQLGCYGKEYMHTPNIDQLASEGRMFQNHFVHCAACGPSRCTLLSGHRTLDWDIWRDIRESNSKPDSIFSLPQLFKENSYKTVCIGKVSHLPGGVIDPRQKIHEMPYSWDKAYAPVGEWDDPWGAFFSYEGGKTRLYGYNRGNDTDMPPYEAADVSDEGYADGLNAMEAIRQLQNLKDTSFFLAVGFYKPHLPFNAPKKYWDLYDRIEIPEAVYKEIPQNVESNICLHDGHRSYEPRTHYRWPNDTSNYLITPERQKILKHGYCAAVSYIDAQVGKIIKELKRLDLEDNTLVVLWGDHGWHLGEYGIWGKYTNFDIALRSPLIVKLPGMKKPGVQAQGIVETVDIFPTLAELCELPVPEHLEGMSMKPIIDDPGARIKKYALGERNAWGVHGYTIRNEQYRLMTWIDQKGDTMETQLFENDEEPLPIQNVANDHPREVNQLLEILKNSQLN